MSSYRCPLTDPQSPQSTAPYPSSLGLLYQYYIALLGMVVISVLIYVAIATSTQTRLV